VPRTAFFCAYLFFNIPTDIRPCSSSNDGRKSKDSKELPYSSSFYLWKQDQEVQKFPVNHPEALKSKALQRIQR
jgi:hypothetical protein